MAKRTKKTCTVAQTYRILERSTATASRVRSSFVRHTTDTNKIFAVALGLVKPKDAANFWF